MINDEWTYQIERQMPFEPTLDQHEALVTMGRFLSDRSARTVMIMRGSAGTGKTSVARAIVNALTSMKQKVVLMAPTGRAAKVFSQGIDRPALTIHRKIYRQQAYMSENFSLADNLHTDTLFIVDEASMISHDSLRGESLLDHLIRYVYSGRNCRLMLIGDTAQLPPVGAEEAPALMSDFIAGYGLTVYDYFLCEVLRQSEESGILYNATMLRSMITHDEMTELPVIRLSGFPDISVCPGNELIEQLGSSYSRVGHDETIVITRSNKRANIYNLGIRNQVLGQEDELCGGDMLMIVKNNYFWADKEGTDGERERGFSFLANGDRCVVRRVRNTREMYGFRFADVQLELPDYDYYEFTATIILDTLTSEAPALTAAQQEQLYNNVMEDYADIPLKKDRLSSLRKDVYFNALQVKYAYAVTCHKAQGGQWEHVYLDQGYMTDDMVTPSYIHWLYTAFTRATRHLYLVNWPKNQLASAEDDD